MNTAEEPWSRRRSASSSILTNRLRLSRGDTYSFVTDGSTRSRTISGESVEDAAMVSFELTRAPNVEWCVFEERAGMGPALDHSEGMAVFLTP